MDYHSPKVKKIEEQADRSWIDGFEVAIEEVDEAFEDYKKELEKLEPSVKQMRYEAVQHFVQFLKDDMLRMRDGMIDAIIEEQATDEEKATL
jgi:hypothetical protein